MSESVGVVAVLTLGAVALSALCWAWLYVIIAVAL